MVIAILFISYMHPFNILLSHAEQDANTGEDHRVTEQLQHLKPQ